MECNVTDGSRYFSHSTSTCQVCTGSVVAPILIAFFLLLFVAVLAFLYQKYKPHERFPWFNMAYLRLVAMANSLSLRAKVKQVVGFYQVVTNIPKVYNVEFPSSSQAVLDDLEVLNLNIFDAFGLPLDCVQLSGFKSELTFMMVAPIAIALLILVGAIAKQWFDLVRGDQVRDSMKKARGSMQKLESMKKLVVLDGGSWKRTKRGALIALPPVSVLSFLVFPAVSSIAFRAWDCVYFDKDTELERSFLRSDLRIECETPAHDDILRLAYLGIVLYPVFIPLAYLLLLFSARGAIVKDRPTRLSTALAFLHRDFEAQTYWWEIAEAYKKLFLVGFMTIIANDSIVQIGIAIAFVLIFMLISSIAAPYRANENDYFAVACNFSLTAVFFFCSMLKVKVLTDSVAAYMTKELVDRFYFNEIVIAGCLLVCVVAALVLACVLSVQSILAAANVPTLRLVSTGNRPELALAKGHKWHLFLSHIWSTGQDQCAAIKRNMQLLLPGCQIFLDVDDLLDIGALEEYIEQSAVIMIFVSKGYFKSKNCLREVRCATSKDKRLSLMHDPVRGGASLDFIIEEECPTEMRSGIFDLHPIISFHRIKDFQVVSLKLLAEDLLLGCPNFKAETTGRLKTTEMRRLGGSRAGVAGRVQDDDHRHVELALPGELTRKKLSFNPPITHGLRLT